MPCSSPDDARENSEYTSSLSTSYKHARFALVFVFHFIFPTSLSHHPLVACQKLRLQDLISVSNLLSSSVQLNLKRTLKCRVRVVWKNEPPAKRFRKNELGYKNKYKIYLMKPLLNNYALFCTYTHVYLQLVIKYINANWKRACKLFTPKTTTNNNAAVCARWWTISRLL